MAPAAGAAKSTIGTATAAGGDGCPAGRAPKAGFSAGGMGAVRTGAAGPRAGFAGEDASDLESSLPVSPGFAWGALGFASAGSGRAAGAAATVVGGVRLSPSVGCEAAAAASVGVRREY